MGARELAGHHGSNILIEPIWIISFYVFDFFVKPGHDILVLKHVHRMQAIMAGPLEQHIGLLILFRQG